MKRGSGFRQEREEVGGRVNITGRHNWVNGVSATVRANWYGDYMLSSRSLDEFQTMSGDVYWDLDFTWDVNDALSVTIGGNNVFDAAPDAPPDFLICCGILNDEREPFRHSPEEIRV